MGDETIGAIAISGAPGWEMDEACEGWTGESRRQIKVALSMTKSFLLMGHLPVMTGNVLLAFDVEDK